MFILCLNKLHQNVIILEHTIEPLKIELEYPKALTLDAHGDVQSKCSPNRWIKYVYWQTKQLTKQ